MGEFPAATSSDTDEEDFLDIFARVQLGERLVAYLTEEEAGRVGVSCHFTLDCLCERRLFDYADFGTGRVSILFSPFTRLVNIPFPVRNDTLRCGLPARLARSDGATQPAKRQTDAAAAHWACTRQRFNFTDHA